jgi:IMP dehydrogenase/GMP reductase
MLDKEPRLGLTYDDVVLVPAKSQILPSEVDMRTRLTRHININIPIISSAMDTVTESRLAIAIAREGGIGIIHRVLSPVDQATEVDRVKKSESGMILDPITISPDQTIRDAHALMAKYRISGIHKRQEISRHSHESRSAVRDPDGFEGLANYEAGQIDHGARRDELGKGSRGVARASD